MTEQYRIVIAQSAKEDIKAMKTYILQQFKYRELAEAFSQKIKKIIMNLNIFPESHRSTGISHRGYDIYLKAHDTYLIFYTIHHTSRTITILRVMKKGMDWQYHIRLWSQNT